MLAGLRSLATGVLLTAAGMAVAQEPVAAPKPALPAVEEPAPAKVLPDPAAPAEPEDLAAKVEALTKRMTVITVTDDCRLTLGGAITADFFYNHARPVAPGVPFFLTPGSLLGFNQDTFDANARQTSLFALVTGPDVCGFQSGGFILANLFNDAVINDRYGLLPIQAYGELKNDRWRFAAGLQIDIFNAPFPDVLPFSLLLASGNTGVYRTQARVEHYLHPSDTTQVTIIAGISEPIPTTITETFDVIDLSEDNGWPNVESRVVLGLGPLTGEGAAAQRPLEWGVSGVVGELRSLRVGSRQVLAKVWGLGTDLRWAVTERFGIKGEGFVGQTLGTYGGGILQDVNAVTKEGVQASGGWLSVYYILCPDKLRTNIGYGIDDPLDRDLAPGQPVRNETYFTNAIWDVTKHFRVAGELTYRKTAYTLLPNNDGLGFQAQFQWKF